MTPPLRAWSRPLTPRERALEREHEAQAAPPVLFSIHAWVERWFPLLPPDVPQCAICTLPHREELCAGCRKLRRAHGRPLTSLELLTISTKHDGPEVDIWAWKTEVERSGLEHAPAAWIGGIGSHLSTYCELTLHVCWTVAR